MAKKRKFEFEDTPANVVSGRNMITGAGRRVVDGMEEGFGIRGVFLTPINFAKECRQSLRYVNAKITENSLQARAGKHGEALYSLYDLIQVCVLKASGAPDTSKMSEADRRAHWAGELDAIRVQEEMADLCRREDVEATYRELCREFISFCDALPGHIKRNCEPDAVILARIESAIGVERQRLYGHMQKGIGKTKAGKDV